jgi:hypothetical protein
VGERVSGDFGGGDLVREVRHAGEAMTLTRGELEYLLLLATTEQQRVHVHQHGVLHPVLFPHCQHPDCLFVHEIADLVAGIPRKKHQLIEVA